MAWVPVGASASFTAKDIEILPSQYVGSGRGEFTYRVSLMDSGGAQLWTKWNLAAAGVISGSGPYAWVAVGTKLIGTWVNTTGAAVPVLVKADADRTFAGADTRYTLQVAVTGGASDPAPACVDPGPLTASNGGVAPNPRISLNQCATGQPISCATGDFWHTFNDLAVPGRGPALNLQRTYNAFAHGSDSMFGYGWSNSYGMKQATDTAGDVTVAQENGSTITFLHDGSGGFTAPPRVLASLIRNADGTLTLTDSHGGMRHTFAAAGRLLSQKDRNGMTTTLGYDAQNRIVTVTDPAGRALTFGYGSAGRVATATDPAGRSVTYSYDGSGNLVSTTNVNGGVWAHTYDSAHQMLTMTDPRGGDVATNIYDGAGRVTTQSDALNRTTTLAYSGDPATALGSTTTITDPRGNVTKQAYVQFQMKSITRAFGTAQAATTTYSYDPAITKVASKTDPNHHTTSYTWDSRGNQTSSTDPLGRTTSTSWTALNEPATVTDAAGHVTTFGYDTRGNRVTQNRPVNAAATQASTFTYGDAAHPGDITSMTDPTGKTWTMVYNANGDLTKGTNPLGGATSFEYDGIGRRTSMVSARGNAAGANPAAFTTGYIYDLAGALTKSTDPLGHATSYGYDADGNRTTVTDPLGHVTTTTFDAENQPTKVTRADGTALNYGYDTGGNQTSQTNANAKTTSYVYDPLGQVSSSRDPLNRATTYGYSPAGQLTNKTDPAGRVTAFGYDAAGQRTTLTYSDAKTPNVTYTYTTLGQRATMIDGAGTTTYTYDWLGRLTGSTNGAGQATSYAYDLAGHLTALTYPNAKVVTRGYDDAGRLHTVTDWLGHTNTLSPDADSNPASVVSGNGLTATSTFDNADQLSSITDTAAGNTVASFGYTRDANGQLASTTPTGVTQGNETYPYTQLNQLAGVNTTTYDHDGADNLTKLTNGTTQTFDAADQLTAAVNAGATTTHTNDTNGNRTASAPPAGDKTSYAYDQAQRLSEVQRGKLYQPLTPARIANTTIGSGLPYAGQSLAPGGTLAVQVTGTGGVPATGVAAVVLSVTALNATAATNLTVFPTGVARPATSNLNVVAGASANNEVTVGVGTNGQVSIYNSLGTTNLVVDVLGYYSAGGAGMNAITPVRIADTRVGSGKPYAGQPVPANGSLTIQVAGTAGVPAGATAAILQAVAITPTAAGDLVAYPAGTTRPAVSNLSYKVGVTLAKEITAGLGTTPVGAVTFYNASSAPLSLVLDITGYINGTGDTLTPLTPARIADTRTGSGLPNAGQTLTIAGTVTIQATGRGGIPANAHSVVVNVSVPSSTTSGTLTIYPGGPRPATTSLTRTAGAIAFNQVTTKLSATGTFTIYNSAGTADVTIDVMGSYGPLAAYTYNGDGLRATRTTTTTGTQKYAFDPTSNVPLLLTDGSMNYIYDDAGNPLEQVDAAGVALYYQHDQYGSTRLLTNATGAIAATFSYDPYGNLTGRTGTADTPLRWNGQYQDSDTGLYYLRARYYDPTTAQFIIRDPLEALTGAAYGYANGNPLNAADPMGLCSWYDQVCGGLTAAAWLVGHTIGGCLNGSAGFGGFGTVSGCFAFVAGHPTLTFTSGGGLTTGTASVTGGLLVGNAQNPSQLEDWFGNIGASAGEGLVVGDDWSGGHDSCGNLVWTNQMAVGVGAKLPLPAELHGAGTWTEVWSW